VGVHVGGPSFETDDWRIVAWRLAD